MEGDFTQRGWIWVMSGLNDQRTREFRILEQNGATGWRKLTKHWNL